MAQETEWSLSGTVRVATFYEDWDRNANINYLGRATAIDDDSDLTWDTQANTRFAMDVSAGDISGKFEIAAHDEGTTGMRARRAYGVWDFGVGSILIGRDYSPSELWNGSNQRWWGDNALTGLGYWYAGRNNQIKFTFPVGGGTFQFAFVEPNAALSPVAGVMGAGTTELDTDIPKLEAMFTHNFGPIYWIITGGYATYDENVIATERDYSIDSYMIGTCLGYTAGPFYAYGAIYVAENPTNYGQSFGYDWELGAQYIAATDGIDDEEMLGWSIVAGFSPNDMITLEAGYGWGETDVNTAVGTNVEDESSMYYLQCVINVAPGFRVIPEIGVYDLDDRTTTGAATVDQGDATYFGAQWRIDF
jgi:hypothetical protein